MSDTTLALFWKLASDQPDTRVAASEALFSALAPQLDTIPSAQPSDQGAASASDDNQNDTLASHVDQDAGQINWLQAPSEQRVKAAQSALDRLPREVSYAITRLIRGLASPRASARLGFATALAPLLAKCTTLSHNNRLSATAFLELVLHNTAVPARASGQEERDGLFAKLFAIHALALGPALTDQCDLAPHTGLKLATRIVLATTAAKAWLSDAAAAVLVQLYRVARAQSSPDAETWMRNTLFPTSQKAVLTSDRLSVLIAAQYVLPPNSAYGPNDQDWTERVCPPLKQAHALVPANVPVLARLLLDQAVETDQEHTQAANKRSSTWSAELPIGLRLLIELYASVLPPPSEAASFASVWNAVVDEQLLADSSSAERKLWGFKMFQLMLLSLSRLHTTRDVRTEVSALISPNLVRQLVYHSRQSDRLLYAAANQTIQVVRQVAQSTPALARLILEQVQLSEHADQGNVSSLLSTDILAALSQDSSETSAYVDTVQQTIQTFLQPSQATEEGEEDGVTVTPRALWALDELVRLLRSGGKKDESMIKRTLGLLTIYATVAPKDGFVPLETTTIVPDVVRAAALAPHALGRLLSALGDLMSDSDEHWVPWVWDRIAHLASRAYPTEPAKSKGKKRKSGSEPMKPTAQWLLDQRMGAALAGVPIPESEEEEQEFDAAVALTVARAQLAQLSTQDDDTVVALRDLVSAGGLYALKEARGGAEALSQTLAAIAPHEHEHEHDHDHDHDHDHGALLVQAVLACTAQPSAFLRSVAERVFAVYAAKLGPAAIEAVVSQLLPPPVDESEDEDEAMPDADDEQVRGESGSDSEGSSSDSDSDSDSDSNSDQDQDQEGEGDLDPELAKKLEEALGEAGDAGSDADDTESVHADDDEMLALDGKLAAIFRMQRRSTDNSSKSKRAEEAASAAVQNRVLDLLDVFVRRSIKLAHSASPEAQPGAGSQASTVVFLLQPLLALVTEAEADNKAATNKSNKAEASKGKSKMRQARAEVSVTKASKATALIGRITGAKEPVWLPVESEAHAQAIELVSTLLSTLSAPTPAPAALQAEKVTLFLTRSLLHSAPPNFQDEGWKDLVNAYSDAIRASLGLGPTRKSAIRTKFLTDALNRFPPLGWAVRGAPIPALTVQAESKTQAVQALGLIQVVANQAVLGATKSEVVKPAEVQTYLTEVFGAALALVEQEAARPPPPQVARFKEEIKFLMAIQRMRRRLDSEAVGPKTEQVRLNVLYESLTVPGGVYATTKSVHDLTRQLLAMLGAPTGKEKPKNKKRPLPDDAEHADNTVADTTNASFVSAQDLGDQSASKSEGKLSKKSKKNKKPKTA